LGVWGPVSGLIVAAIVLNYLLIPLAFLIWRRWDDIFGRLVNTDVFIQSPAGAEDVKEGL